MGRERGEERGSKWRTRKIRGREGRAVRRKKVA